MEDENNYANNEEYEESKNYEHSINPVDFKLEKSKSEMMKNNNKKENLENLANKNYNKIKSLEVGKKQREKYVIILILKIHLIIFIRKIYKFFHRKIPYFIIYI